MELIDIMGNIYKTVKIGNQIWMAENFRTIKYNDGTEIPLIEDNITWISLSTPGYCWYNNDIVNKNKHGALYNWYVINTCKLAPMCWHVPTDDEWNILTFPLTLQEVKDFFIYSKGCRNYDGIFHYYNYWWSSTVINKESGVFSRGLGISQMENDDIYYLYDGIDRKNCGFSIRLVMD